MILTKKPSKMTLKIDQNSIKNQSKKWSKKWYESYQKTTPKVTPKGTPKSSKNRPWGHLGPQDGPRMFQEGFRDPIWTIFDRCWTHFGPIFDQILTNFGQNFDRNCTKFGSYFDEAANWFAIIIALIWDRSLRNHQLNQHGARLLCLWWFIPN